MNEERDGGRTDIYAPCSNWNADLANAREYTLAEGTLATIAPNDWVDIDEDFIAIDPMWGSSFQVYDCPEGSQVRIRWYNKDSDLYEIIGVDTNLIWNCYRRVGS